MLEENICTKQKVGETNGVVKDPDSLSIVLKAQVIRFWT